MIRSRIEQQLIFCRASYSLYLSLRITHLCTLSHLPGSQREPELNTHSFSADSKLRPLQLNFLQNGQNPFQRGWGNLPAAAATRVVGGMGSHWTCCTPRQHKIERSTLFSDTEWSKLYPEVERLFGTNSTSFKDSIRQQLVKHVLQDAYSDSEREIRSMPLACKRSEGNKDYVEWSCTATILGALSEPGYSGNLEVRPNTQCVRLQLDDQTGQVAWVVLKDLLSGEDYYLMANKYVICAGAVLTPGILVNSGFNIGSLPALVSQEIPLKNFVFAKYVDDNRVAI